MATKEELAEAITELADQIRQLRQDRDHHHCCCHHVIWYQTAGAAYRPMITYANTTGAIGTTYTIT